MIFGTWRNLSIFLTTEVATKYLQRALVGQLLLVYRLILMAFDAYILSGSLCHRGPVYLPLVDGLFQLAFDSQHSVLPAIMGLVNCFQGRIRILDDFELSLVFDCDGIRSIRCWHLHHPTIIYARIWPSCWQEAFVTLVSCGAAKIILLIIMINLVIFWRHPRLFSKSSPRTLF